MKNNHKFSDREDFHKMLFSSIPFSFVGLRLCIVQSTVRSLKRLSKRSLPSMVSFVVC